MVQASQEVGRHLLEHLLLMMQYALGRPLSQNAAFRGPRLYWNAARYFLTRTGPFASGSYDVAAFMRTDPGDPLPDVEILIAPFSLGMNASGRVTTGADHAIHLFGYPLRYRSEGSVMIAAADPDIPARIVPNYLGDPYDQATTLRMTKADAGAIELPARTIPLPRGLGRQAEQFFDTLPPTPPRAFPPLDAWSPSSVV